MLNLLSKEQKEVLRKEYTKRLVVVWLGAVLSAFVISLVLLVPSYFLTRVRAGEVVGELESTRQALEAKLPPRDVVAAVEDAVRSADALRPLVKPKSVFDLVSIFESKPRTITISRITYKSATEDTPAQMTIEGKAGDRESLTTFGKTLQGRVEFEAVDIPVSNFVREKDIVFAMTAILKP